MKNLKIGSKLLVGFGILIIMLAIVSILSMLSFGRVGGQIDLYARYTVPNNTMLGAMNTYVKTAQRDMALGMGETEASEIAEHFGHAQASGSAFMETLEAYANNQRDNSREADIAEMKEYVARAATVRREIAEVLNDPTEENIAYSKRLFDTEYMPNMNVVVGILEHFSEDASVRAERQGHDAQAAVTFARMIILSFGISAVIIAFLLAVLIARSILKPVRIIMAAYSEIAKGNMNTSINYEGKDELGEMTQLIKTSMGMQSEIIADVIEKFIRLSQGDLRLDVTLDYPGDFAPLKTAIEDTVAGLNNTMNIISTAAEQVSIGSSQVSDGAQALSSGSTEQAASVEELGATVTQIAGQAEHNLENVAEAQKEVVIAAEALVTGTGYMTSLTNTMQEIQESSDEIANITKVIEDIAFQTNILALNAAIEAARAGEAGKGFAVVADEVRNLAGKSGEAAKQTAELIQNSIAIVKQGNEITGLTAEALTEVEESARRVGIAMDKVEAASKEQSNALGMINDGLMQVSSVVQMNAATAEENSATSEEMSAQAAMLNDEVSKFRLKSQSGSSLMHKINFDAPTLKELPGSADIQTMGKY